MLSAAATVDQWRLWWGVRGAGTEVAQANPVLDDGPSQQLWRYGCNTVVCPGGTPANLNQPNVVLVIDRVAGGGHSAPGVTQLPPIVRALVGWRNLDIAHVDTALRFFGLE